MYSIRNQAPTYLAKCFKTNEMYGQHRVTRGHNKLHLKVVNTEFGRKATRFKGAQDWNRLPERMRSIENIKTFRTVVKLHLVSNFFFVFAYL